MPAGGFLAPLPNSRTRPGAPHRDRGRRAAPRTRRSRETGELLTRYRRDKPTALAGSADALLAVILLIWRVTRSRRRKKITVTEAAPQIAHPAAEAARAAPKLTAGPPAQPDNRIESMMM